MIQRTTRPRRPKRKTRVKPRKRLKAECDRLFSQFIRLRDGDCRINDPGHRCSGSLQCAHGFSRRYVGTRWEPLNAWALCQGAHYRYTMRPLEWDEWMREELGSSYEGIRRQALRGGMPDLEQTRERLRWLVRKYEAMNGAC